MIAARIDGRDRADCLIKIYGRDGWTDYAQDLLKKLADYEDAEEAGRLLILPGKYEGAIQFNPPVPDGPLDRYTYNVILRQTGTDADVQKAAEIRRRLLKLAELEEAGRLVVLPCKEGDEVYATHMNSAQTIPKIVRGLVISVYSDYGPIGQVTKDGTLQPPLYLTRKEAEAAIKEAANV